ncbi:hypothetical protein SUGI_0912570 [Cryptomeria japonica]|nr:hypothetical protein SUGI_0912570 [Cryptomeria japonica]
MAKSIYVFLLFAILLPPPFASANYGPDYTCRSLSGAFHGSCVAWRWDECVDTCKNQDHQKTGECDWNHPHGLACWCIHDC